MRFLQAAILVLLVAGCETAWENAAPPAAAPAPPERREIRLKVVESVVTHAGVEEQCAGRFTVRNVGPAYVNRPDEFGPSYGVFIYDEQGTLLFRAYGGWGPGMKEDQEMPFFWDTHSNHLGEKSEPPFLIPRQGRYKLKICIYHSTRDKLLDTSETFFTVGETH